MRPNLSIWEINRLFKLNKYIAKTSDHRPPMGSVSNLSEFEPVLPGIIA